MLDSAGWCTQLVVPVLRPPGVLLLCAICTHFPIDVGKLGAWVVEHLQANGERRANRKVAEDTHK